MGGGRQRANTTARIAPRSPTPLPKLSFLPRQEPQQRNHSLSRRLPLQPLQMAAQLQLHFLPERLTAAAKLLYRRHRARQHMTAKPSTIAAESGAVPPPTDTPEEAEQLDQQGSRNEAHLVEIFIDLLREHPGRFVMVYGDRQVLIGDDPRKMEDSLSKEERETALCLPLSSWWLEIN